jgi:hypothetical protein
MKDLYQIKLEATNLLLNEKASKNCNLLTRKEAYKSIKDGFCVWALKKSANHNYIKVMENWANDKLLYVKKYGLYADKLNFENFNFNVNKLQEKTKESILLLQYLAKISRKKLKK